MQGAPAECYSPGLLSQFVYRYDGLALQHPASTQHLPLITQNYTYQAISHVNG
jgi:hypothetical protein